MMRWKMEAKHGAFFQPAGTLARGTCVVHARLLAAGEECLVLDSQFGRHTLRWRDDGARVLEQNDTKRSAAPETVAGGAPLGRPTPVTLPLTLSYSTPDLTPDLT